MWQFTGEGDMTSVIQGFQGRRSISSMQHLLFANKGQIFREDGADVGYQAKRTPSKV